MCYTVYRHKFHHIPPVKDVYQVMNVHTKVLPQQPRQNRVSVRDEVTLLLFLTLQYTNIHLSWQKKMAIDVKLSVLTLKIRDDS